MPDQFSEHARRAGEEYLAASRATTPERRAAHLALAERYVERIRQNEAAYHPPAASPAQMRR